MRLETSGFEYLVTGSIASIVYGEPRLTHDIDLVLHLLPQVHSQLDQEFLNDQTRQRGLSEIWKKISVGS